MRSISISSISSISISVNIQSKAQSKGQSKGRSKDADVVLLRSCPLLESARENQDVICSVHLGLVRGARRTLGASDADPSLEPFAQRGACRLHLPA